MNNEKLTCFSFIRLFLFYAYLAQTPAARQTAKRKRKLVIDEVKEIDSTSMKTQLSDTTDIVGVLELAPPTRRLMHLKETGGIEKLFSAGATSMFSKTLQQVRCFIGQTTSVILFD
jgi:hypothetical protein